MTQVADQMAEPKKKRSERAVKIPRDLAVKAKVIAEANGVTIADYLGPIIRPAVERDWPKAVKKIEQPEDE